MEAFQINFSYAYKGMNQLKKAFLAQGANLSDLIEDETQTQSFKFKKLDYFSNSHHLASLEAELKLDQLFLFLQAFCMSVLKNTSFQRIGGVLTFLLITFFLFYFTFKSSKWKTLYLLLAGQKQLNSNPLFQLMISQMIFESCWLKT